MISEVVREARDLKARVALASSSRHAASVVSRVASTTNPACITAAVAPAWVPVEWVAV